MKLLIFLKHSLSLKENRSPLRVANNAPSRLHMSGLRLATAEATFI
jgi:hypothetical protein